MLAPSPFPPALKAVLDYAQLKGTTIQKTSSPYFHINLPLDSMSFQTTRECDEWPNECIISVVGVQTFAWRTVLCCTAGTLSSISCRVWAKCPPDFSVQSWKALWFHQWWNPGQDLRVLIMSVINIFHFQVALVCLPLRDVSAESQAGLSSFVSLTFFYRGLSKGERE